MVQIRNAARPGPLPAYIAQPNALQPETEQPARDLFAELNEFCAERGIPWSRFEEEVQYRTLFQTLRDGRKPRPDTLRRIEAAKKALA